MTHLERGVQGDGTVLDCCCYGGGVHAGEERRILKFGKMLNTDSHGLNTYLSQRGHHRRRLRGQERLDRLHSLEGLAGLHQLEGGVGQQRGVDTSVDST